MCHTKHVIAWENSRVITTNNRHGQRRCLEAWHINMRNHALNRDDGAYLPEEYTDTDITQHTPYQGFSVTGYIRTYAHYGKTAR